MLMEFMPRLFPLFAPGIVLVAACGPRGGVERPACVELDSGQGCETCCQQELEHCQKKKQGEFLDCLMEQDLCSEHAYEASGASASSFVGEFAGGVPPDLHCHWQSCSSDSSELCPRCLDRSEDCDIDLTVCVKLCQPQPD
jgi:hypothetical protein